MGKERRDRKMMPWFPPFANFLLRPQTAVGNGKAQSGVGWEVLCGSKDRRMEASEIRGFDEQLLCACPGQVLHT